MILIRMNKIAIKILIMIKNKNKQKNQAWRIIKDYCLTINNEEIKINYYYILKY